MKHLTAVDYNLIKAEPRDEQWTDFTIVVDKERLCIEFTLALEDIFKKLNWEKPGIKIDGQYLTHLRFADDIVLISNNVEELQEMLKQLKEESEKVGLKMNLSKTKVMSEQDFEVEIDGNEIEKVTEYVYLGHTITLGKQNQTAEITRRIRMTRAAVGKLFKKSI